MFSVGMKVMCIDTDWEGSPQKYISLPTLGGIYTIRSVFQGREAIGTLLSEIHNPDHHQGQEYGFLPRHFRPLDDIPEFELGFLDQSYEKPDFEKILDNLIKFLDDIGISE